MPHTKPTALPTINLNGSSRESLANGYHDAWHAVTRAMDALGDAAPHGRDYPQGSAAFETARREHYERVRKLEDVAAGLFDLFEHVDG